MDRIRCCLWGNRSGIEEDYGELQEEADRMKEDSDN